MALAASGRSTTTTRPVACISSRFYPDEADRSEAAGLSLPVEEAAQENVQMGRGKRHQGCESAAGHRVGIERIGNGQVKRPYCAGDNAFRAPPGAESG